MEKDHDDGRNPVAFISRTLYPHEQNYAAHDLGLLHIVDGKDSFSRFKIKSLF